MQIHVAFRRAQGRGGNEPEERSKRCQISNKLFQLHVKTPGLRVGRVPEQNVKRQTGFGFRKPEFNHESFTAPNQAGI